MVTDPLGITGDTRGGEVSPKGRVLAGNVPALLARKEKWVDRGIGAR